MSDQQGAWWTDSQNPAPPPPALPAPPPPGAEPTVVIPRNPPGAPPPPEPAPQYGQVPPYGNGPVPGMPPPTGTPGQIPAPVPGYSPQFVPPAAPNGTYRAPGGSITMIVGALIAVVGTLLPWVTFGQGGFSDSINGYETYFIGEGLDVTEWANPGAYVLGGMLLVIVMAVAILTVGRSTATWILGLISVGIAGLMTFGALGAVGSVLDNEVFTGFDIGVGIVLCMVGAVIALVGAIIVAAKKS